MQAQRHAADRLEVFRDVVAGLAVAAGRAGFQQAVFVAQVHREAVDLWLDEPCERLAGEQLFHAHDPFAQRVDAVLREEIVERKHRHRVAHAFETGRRLFPDTPRRRVGRDQPGVGVFEVAEFAEKGVVFRVGNRGRGFVVVAAVVLLKLAPEPGEAC